jgi:predicted metal-binding membrane protein
MSASVLRAATAGLRHHPTVVAVLVVAAAAWIALIMIAVSPWSSYFGHAALEYAGQYPWETAVLTISWTTMVAAMMLPTTVPLLAMFERLTSSRPDRRRLLVWLVCGYMLAWLAVGVAMHVGDLGVHWSVRHWQWLSRNTWVIGATTLAVAGGYQFTAAKARCLTRCRTPESFIRRRWQGGRVSLQSFRIGLDNGVFCVGCCWALMLVMFAAGVANVAWMAALTLVMVTEKTWRLGRRVTTPVGLVLISAALLAMLAR